MTSDKSIEEKLQDLNIDKLIGQKIKDLRLKHKLSQEELGRRCGVSFQQIQKYEKGTNKLSFSRLADIANIFNVPLELFLNNNNNRTSPSWNLNEAQASFDCNNVYSNNKIEENLLNLFNKINSLEDKELKIKIIKILDVLIN